MRIGMNLLFMLPGQVGGTETYSRELIRILGEIDHENDYILFVNLESADLPLPPNENFRKVVCRVSANNRVLRYLFEQLLIPFLATWYRLDLLHSLGYVGPVLLLQKHIITIHDANFTRLSRLMSPIKRLVYGGIARLSATTCNHILTVSTFARNEVIECLNVPGAKVSVVHLGVNCNQGMSPENLPNSRLLPDLPYIFAIGGGSPHKNIRSLVQAFVSLGSQLPYRLVIAGHVREPLDDIDGVPELIQTRQIWLTGYLTEATLDLAYRRATLFVFPSLYEGFGFPILEAQSRGLPVLCSRVASLPEIGGDSVEYFDPSIPQDLSLNLSRLISEPERLQTLSDLGLRNVQRFTWHQTGELTRSIYLSHHK